jgi:hypothetical protein
VERTSVNEFDRERCSLRWCDEAEAQVQPFHSLFPLF